jgi:hypothetical protein
VTAAPIYAEVNCIGLAASAFRLLRQRAAIAPLPPSMHATVLAKASACARRRDVQAG